MPVKKSTRRKVKPKSTGPASALKVTIHSCANGQRGVSGAQFFIEDKHGIRIVSSRVYKDGAEARRVAGWMISQLAADNFESFDHT